MLPATGNLRFQLDYVARAAQRLIALQDNDPLSPSYGCFHAAYWRDKTSDFPDARFQEAGAALGLLSLPSFNAIRAIEPSPNRDELLSAFLAGARNLARQQYVEGSYDEWYKGERGFAATAFTTVAYGFAALYLGELIPDDARVQLHRTLTRAADWLSRRDDFVKVNHEIAAAASLAVVWRLTGDLRHRDASRKKFERSIKYSNPEGWFNELGGCDLGYSHLLFDYLALYFLLTTDADVLPVAGALLAFLAPHLHPNLTVATEAGTCRNAYVGQIGFIVHKAQNLTAASIDVAMRCVPDNWLRISCYLADDVRLARWAILPILAALLLENAPSNLDEVPLAEIYPRGWTVHPAACLASFHENDLHLFAPVAGGAITRMFLNEKLIGEDLGIDVRVGDEMYTTKFYDRTRVIRRIDNGVSFVLPLGRANYVFPTLAQRLALRVGSTTSRTSRLTRALIDRYRCTKNTAINQSATLVGVNSERLWLERRIYVRENETIIFDTLHDRAAALSSDTLCVNFRVNGQGINPFSETFSGAAEVSIKKSICRRDGTFNVLVQWT